MGAALTTNDLNGGVFIGDVVSTAPATLSLRRFALERADTRCPVRGCLMHRPAVADEVLIASIDQGDRHAMAALFECYRVPVARLVLRMVRNKATAEPR